MRYNTLGRTDIKVSDLCLGSMTWGTRTGEDEAHAQIDMALDHGINFIDTAEMYPVTPVLAETIGRTEEIVGTWLAKTGRRSDIVLATKITGANGGFCRDGAPISPKEIVRALDGSLKRLQTDVIDLYQLHWPNRGSYAFRQNWTYDPSKQDRAETVAHMDEVLDELQRQVDAGKIRHVGLSNESAWGTMMWLARAEAVGGPRMQSIQNEYSLLYRPFDMDLAEVAANEQVGLLTYSPLGGGLLTGKYRNGACPENSRMAHIPDLSGRNTEKAHTATEAYLALAQENDLDLVHLALGFCRARPFMTSTIFGATQMPELERILAGVDTYLSEDVLAAITNLHRAHPMPY